MTKHPKRPRDLNQWAKRMVDLATMDDEDRARLTQQRSSSVTLKGESELDNQKPGKKGVPPS